MRKQYEIKKKKEKKNCLNYRLKIENRNSNLLICLLFFDFISLLL